jgi:D-lyxose ketol-isomerase
MPRHKGIDVEIRLQAEKILIVVELQTRPTTLKRHGDDRRIGVTRLEGKLMTRLGTDRARAV